MGSLEAMTKGSETRYHSDTQVGGLGGGQGHHARSSLAVPAAAAACRVALALAALGGSWGSSGVAAAATQGGAICCLQVLKIAQGVSGTVKDKGSVRRCVGTVGERGGWDAPPRPRRRLVLCRTAPFLVRAAHQGLHSVLKPWRVPGAVQDGAFPGASSQAGFPRPGHQEPGGGTAGAVLWGHAHGVPHGRSTEGGRRARPAHV